MRVPFRIFRRGDLWGDAVNYEHGHWLNGRIAAAPLGALIEAICDHYDFHGADASALEGLIDGAIADAPMAARDLIEPMARAFCVDAVETDGHIAFRPRNRQPVMDVDGGMLVEGKAEEANFAITRAQETDLPNALELAYLETARDYRAASVMSRRLTGSSLREMHLELPCAVPQSTAQARCEILLQETWAGRETVDFALPPSLMALEPGDAVTVTLNGREHPLRIAEIADAGTRRVKAARHDPDVYIAAETPARGMALPVVPIFGRPDVAFLDLPIAGGPVLDHAPWIACHASPWPGTLALLRKKSFFSYTLNRTIIAPAVMGRLLDPLPAGPLWRHDRVNRFRVKLASGALSSVDEEALLGGANVAAIGSPETGWEIIQFGAAELVDTRTYELSILLRGQSGSEPEMLEIREAGSRFVLLGPLVVQPNLTPDEAGLEQVWRVGPSGRDHGDPSYVEITHRGLRLGLRPYAPVHLTARMIDGDVHFAWMRRGRIDADQWEANDIP
ncbi:MAG: phage tail protein, partial [Pseudorhodoplanes sp.]